MLLHEAIRLGSMLKTQGVGFGSNKTSCALEAAADALGITGNARWTQVRKRFPILDQEFAAPFEPPWLWLYRRVTGHELRLQTIIWMLNDCYLWAREQIADWVASIEPPEQAQPKAVEQESVEEVKA